MDETKNINDINGTKDEDKNDINIDEAINTLKQSLTKIENEILDIKKSNSFLNIEITKLNKLKSSLEEISNKKEEEQSKKVTNF